MERWVRKVGKENTDMKAKRKANREDAVLAELLGEEFDERYASRDMPEENTVEEVEGEEGEEEGGEYPPNYIDNAGFARKRRMTRPEENRAMNKLMVKALKKRKEEGYENGGVVDEECLRKLNVAGGRLLMEQLKAARKCAGMTQAAVALRLSGKHHPMIVSKYEAGSGIGRKEREEILAGEAAIGMNLKTLVGLLAVYGLGLRLEVVDYDEMVRWMEETQGKLEDGGFMVEPRIEVEDWEKTYEVRRMEWDAAGEEGRLVPGQAVGKDGKEGE